MNIHVFRYFYHSDKANAAIHMADVKFSPITFAVARELELGGLTQDSEVNEVLSHFGKYEFDKGR